MNSDNENFDELRKLLALKRNEQPPPGYFVYLPGRITSRIRQGEGQLTFWENVFAQFRIGPSFVYAFCLAACCVLSLSLHYSAKAAARAHDAMALNGNEPARAVANEDPVQAGEMAALRNIGATNSTAPVQTVASLFSQPAQGAVMPVSYMQAQ